MATRCPSCATPLADDARFCGACGASLSGAGVTGQETGQAIGQAPGQATGTRIIAGRYRIERKLGEGGMGAVFTAQQISLKRTVALKLLRSELSDDAELVRRFNAEAELAAKLNHPNTVTLYDYGQDTDGTLFIAMEFIEGRSLRQILAENRALPAARAVAILEQVCDSLADAHAHGIVHRDLKPDNVMLSERGKKRDIVRVLDFGIAKLRDQRGDITGMPVTQAGALLGTPQYMAPEQIRGDAVDGRTDIYALGIMLYEMVTGALPFDAASLMHMLSMHLVDPPVPPSQRCPGQIAPAMEALIMAMLAKSPPERPPSMEVVAQRLAEMRGHVAAYQAGAGAPSGVGPTPAAPAFTPVPANPGYPGYPATAAPSFTPAPVSTPASLAAPASMAVAAARAPAQAPASLAHAPIPAPVAGHGPMSAGRRPRGRRHTLLWVGLVVVVIALGAAGGYLGLLPLGGSKRGDRPSADDGPKVDDRPVSTDFYVPPTRDIFSDDTDDKRTTGPR